MPTVQNSLKSLVTVYGNPDYANGLDRLIRKLQARGIKIKNRHQLGIHALAFLAAHEGMKLPERAKPVGTNRYGLPSSSFEQ